jgi:DNA-binding response OmpR family regulator
MAVATILCVDDEPAILYSTQAILTHAGYEVLTAPDAAAGMQLLQSQRVDMVLVDSLPDRDLLISEARRCNHAIKLLLITGDPNKDEPPEVDAIVCKPIAPPDLIRLIADTLKNGVASK